jgi:hypothetical protein
MGIKLRRWVVAVRMLMPVVFILALGCKDRGPSESMNFGASSRRLLVVGMGGWNSCRIESDLERLPTVEGFKEQGAAEFGQHLTPERSFTFAQLQNFVATLKAAGNDVTWLSTCFFLGLPAEKSVWLLNSLGEKKSVATSAAAAEIERLAVGREVILIGHSYGGWMAAAMATSMRSPLAALFTLEAISGEFCPTFAAVTRTSKMHPYCQRAPDTGAVDGAKILAKTKNWVNVFLPSVDRKLDIYSGPYPPPVLNEQVPYTNLGDGPFSNAHHLLGLGANTWNLICDRSKRFLGQNLGCQALIVDQWGRPQ